MLTRVLSAEAAFTAALALIEPLRR